MFSDSDIDSSGFASNWQFSRDSEDSSVQTTEIIGSEKHIQTKECQAVAVQTEDGEVCATTVAYDEDRLADFLGKICPKVIKELDRVNRSNAFASYALASDTEPELKLVTKLELSRSRDVKVSALSWSCTGSVLAVALSHTLHPSWCSHPGQLALYNVDRDQKAASRVLDAASCVRSVSMHPYLASIVAAGTFSGEVLVWDISREGAEATLLNETHTTHNDSITQVRWVLGTSTAVTLVSSGLDGQIIFWKVSPHLSSYHIIERYCCNSSSREAGVSCFAFPYHKQDSFVVALEGGALLQCSTTAATPSPSMHSSEAAKDPVISNFEHEPATTLSVDFSPYHEDLFATVATDQAIRIYSLFQTCPQRVVWGAGAIVGAAWIPAQPYVLSGWGDSNAVTLFNSLTGATLSALAPEGMQLKSVISAAAFNSKSPRLLAIGDLDGTAYVWEVPPHFSTQLKHL